MVGAPARRTNRFAKLENRQAQAKANLTFCQGVERAYWLVLGVTELEEPKSK